MKTLQECKEQIAHDNGWDKWEDITGLSKHAEGILWTMAAELYASQFKSKDNIPEPDSQDELWAKIIFEARHYNGTPHDLQALTEHFKRYYRLNEL